MHHTLSGAVGAVFNALDEDDEVCTKYCLARWAEC